MEDWMQILGLRVLQASGKEVVAEYDAEPKHHQPYGIVHGGVHCSVVESVCSIGAGIEARSRGCGIVGIENHTSFIRAVRSGRISVRATPISQGRRAQLWEATARDEEGRVVCTGRVRLLSIEKDSNLAGEQLSVKNPAQLDEKSGSED